MCVYIYIYNRVLYIIVHITLYLHNGMYNNAGAGADLIDLSWIPFGDHPLISKAPKGNGIGATGSKNWVWF